MYSAHLGKRKFRESELNQGQDCRRRGGWSGRARGRGRGRGTILVGRAGMDERPNIHSRGHPQPHQLGTVAVQNDTAPQEIVPDSGSMSSPEDDDDPPEVVSSKAPRIVADQGAPCAPESVDNQDVAGRGGSIDATGSVPLMSSVRPSPQQPKKPPQNPFASRPSLLRNVSFLAEMCCC